MCGRFMLTMEDAEALALDLGVSVDLLLQYVPRFNIAPLQDHFVVTMEHEERTAYQARWGLVPAGWARGKETKELNALGARMINARADGVAEKPAFRKAFAQRRCVVPAGGFYEWRGPKTDREPMYIRRPHGGLLLFAGLYEPAPWAAEGAAPYTFTIITTEANGPLSEIHERMPVVLDPDEADEWIDPANPNLDSLAKLLDPADDDLLVMSPASKRLNSPRNEGDASLLEPDPPVADAPPSAGTQMRMGGL